MLLRLQNTFRCSGSEAVHAVNESLAEPGWPGACHTNAMYHSLVCFVAELYIIDKLLLQSKAPFDIWDWTGLDIILHWKARLSSNFSECPSSSSYPAAYQRVDADQSEPGRLQKCL